MNKEFDLNMILIILYTIVLLFLDTNGVKNQCLIALEQWYLYMIPSLFPMMLLSNVMVDTGTAIKVGSLLSKTILKPFRISKSGGYCILSGFLFGFPMGAKTVSDLYAHGAICKKEANYLLSFINCIGPMYTLGVISVLFTEIPVIHLLFGIYALPLFYGLFLRYSLYRNAHFSENDNFQFCSLDIVDAVYETVPKSCKAILCLGGYMVLFQLMFVTFSHLTELIGYNFNFIYPLIEISGGLKRIENISNIPLVLFVSVWGGSCCFMQTYNFLKHTKLSMKNYIFHKTNLAILSCIYGIIVNSVL